MAVVRRGLVKQDSQTEQKDPPLFNRQKQTAALDKTCVHDKDQGEQCLHARAGASQVDKGYPSYKDPFGEHVVPIGLETRQYLH